MSVGPLDPPHRTLPSGAVRGRLERLRRPPTTETLFVLALALIGLRLGLRPIGDNSTFVHLRTGIDMLGGDGSSGGGGIPRHDPYSFTAAGGAWTVQSWLVSLVYGGLHRIQGLELVVLFHGVVYAALAAILATLARTGSPKRTCAAAATAIALGVAVWSPRPLAVGLLAFAATVLVVERRWSPWWLLPIGWAWVNSHGSFALGGLWLALVVIGGRRDATRYVPWWLAGTVLGALNPLGPKLLAFPLTLLSKAPNFERVIEWRAPTFRGPFGVTTLVALVVVVAVLARVGTSRSAARPMPWADLLPAVVFLGLALYAQRNLGPAAVVLAPVLGRALSHDDDTTSRAEPTTTSAAEASTTTATATINTAFAAVIAIAAAIFVAVTMSTDPLDLDGYPVEAATHVPQGSRTASTDIGGCYLILERGRSANVLVDDRYDLYPTAVVDDYVALLDGRPSATRILDRRRVDTVLWPADEPLTSILDRTPAEWRRTYGDEEWVVFVRTPASDRNASS